MCKVNCSLLFLNMCEILFVHLFCAPGGYGDVQKSILPASGLQEGVRSQQAPDYFCVVELQS